LKHYASPRFWQCYEQLPENVRAVANRNFELLKVDTRHPSLHFKPVGSFRSVRVGMGHRALAVESNGDLVWFWIGTHAEYDKLVQG
jgi:hypothetical protein